MDIWKKQDVIDQEGSNPPPAWYRIPENSSLRPFREHTRRHTSMCQWPSLSAISMSGGFLSMFGYTREEISILFDNKFINMVYPGDRTKLLQSIEEQLQTNSDLELEYRVMCKNGLPAWVLDKGRLLDDRDGNKCIYCLLVEITDRKRALEELRLSLERYQVIMDQATDIIFEWDMIQDTLIFSHNWLKKFGYEAIRTFISEGITSQMNNLQNIAYVDGRPGKWLLSSSLPMYFLPL